MQKVTRIICSCLLDLQSHTEMEFSLPDITLSPSTCKHNTALSCARPLSTGPELKSAVMTHFVSDVFLLVRLICTYVMM